VTDAGIYFGAPGNLTALPHPRGGVTATRVRPTFTYITGGGGARVSKVVGGRRQYTLGWDSLDLDTFSTLLEYDQGHRGPGPFCLFDPGQRNMLTVNQSSATSETNDTDNFTVGGSGYTLSSDSATYRRGPRSLKITAAYAAVSGTVTLDAPSSSWYGVPVLTSRAAVLSMYAKGGGADAIVELTPRLTWYTTAGAVVSATSGAPATTSSGAWAQLYVTDTPPAAAAYALPSVVTTAGTVSAGAAVYLDQLQMEEGSTPGTWRPGTAVMPVQVMSLVDQWPWAHPDYRSGPAMVLQEVD
jgi:hypothetical protein